MHEDIENELWAIWETITSPWNSDSMIRDDYFNEIVARYSESHRHYHSLKHIQNMLRLAEEFRSAIDNFNTLCFSIFYHDIIYNPELQDNEEQSAELAEHRLKKLGLPDSSIRHCMEQIHATKSHAISEDTDTAFLLDIDLSVLGASAEVYSEYAAAIRKEYNMYPNHLYNPARKQVLQHFLNQEHIYKTPQLQERYEASARQNLKEELLQL